MQKTKLIAKLRIHNYLARKDVITALSEEGYLVTTKIEGEHPDDEIFVYVWEGEGKRVEELDHE